MTRFDSAEARLWRALKRLASVNSFLQTGAHPDDEASALLARLALGDGVRAGYACALRGEGGQNAIGPETGTALGVLRTLEMQEAARLLGIDLYWLNQSLEGQPRDFGFARTPEAAFAVWGRERIVERLVRAIRVHRPDALMPSFLDVPGQHGHHRAVTRASIEAFQLAGDPATFPAHAAEGLAPWQPAKLYLPAWSGAGATYDDEAPPPRATLIVEAGANDPVLGATYAQLGEASRAAHASQGMGAARDAGPCPVALHRLAAREPWPEDESSPFDFLPRTLGDLAAHLPPAAAAPLRDAQAAIEQALAAFPRRREVAAAVHAALGAVRRAQAALPADETDVAARLAIKVRQLAIASRAALLPDARCTIAGVTIVPGGTVEVAVEPGPDAPDGVATTVAAPVGFAVEPAGIGQFRITAPADAAFTSPYRFAVPTDEPASPIHGLLRYALDDVAVEVAVDGSPGIAVVPPAALSASAAAIPWNFEAPPTSTSTLTLTLAAASGRHEVAIEALPQWPVAPQSAAGVAAGEALAFPLPPPRDDAPQQATLRFAIDGAPAQSVSRIVHPRLGAALVVRRAEIALRSLRVRLPQARSGPARIGYIDGGFEENWHWLRRIGIAIELIHDTRLSTLVGYDTVVVGVFAFRTRPALRASLATLKTWMHRGGHLVTLYHRPQDNWDPDRMPAHRLCIGQPSLRWRVCDPQAPVTTLVPDHPLLTQPNPIAPADWEGWVRERGLYFACEWSPSYTALLALADPGEAPLLGGLLSARAGAGRHTHVSLALHHQLPALVPGAYRLFANLLSAGM